MRGADFDELSEEVEAKLKLHTETINGFLRSDRKTTEIAISTQIKSLETQIHSEVYSIKQELYELFSQTKAS
jgi:hypothetical protein